MNYPYSKKSWMALTLATAMLTSVGVASADTTTPAPTSATVDKTTPAPTSASADTTAPAPASAKADTTTSAPTAASTDKTNPAPAAASSDTTVAESKAAATTETTAAPAKETPAKPVTSINNEQLTMDMAVEEALKNNSTLKSLRLDVKIADLNARLVHETVKEISSEFIESLDAAQRKYVDDAKTQSAQRMNALSLQSTEEKIKVAAQKAYYDLLNAQSTLELKKQSLNRAQTQLKVTKAAVDVGTRAKTDLLQAEMGLSGAQAALLSAENEVETARLQLNQTMGADLQKKWKLVDVNKQETIAPLTLEQATAKALKERVEIIQKEEAIKVAQLNYDLMVKYSAGATYKGQMAKNEIEKAKLQLEDENRAVTVEVAQAYNNLNAAKKGVEFKKKAMEAAAESYRLTNLRFENGLTTTLEVIQAEEELTDRENQYQQSVHQYNLAVMNYKTAIGEK